MDELLHRGRNRKTASQIIAEAKASINQNKSSPSSASGAGQQKLLSTKRPFTPRCATERSGRPLSTGLSLQHRQSPLVILEEADNDSEPVKLAMKLAPLTPTDSNSRRADLLQRSQSAGSRLPALVSPVPVASNPPRQQFRPAAAASTTASTTSAPATT